MKDIKYIFTDFDGTVSKYDVIHKFITDYSKGDWTITERQWARGEISSEECLTVQMGMITELTRKEFDNFINNVELDETFADFYRLSKQNDKEIIILSDGFAYFIETILKRHGIEDIKVFSNGVELGEKNGFMTFKLSFPHYYKTCKINSGTCKCAVAKSFAKDFIYIGDGLSDRCIAREAKFLFAKKSLKTLCNEQNIPFYPFDKFSEISDIIYKENLKLI